MQDIPSSFVYQDYLSLQHAHHELKEEHNVLVMFHETLLNSYSDLVISSNKICQHNLILQSKFSQKYCQIKK